VFFINVIVSENWQFKTKTNISVKHMSCVWA